MRGLPALIIAAGKATRMGEYSKEIPKCLFELAPGLPLLDLIVKWLRDEDVGEIIVVTRPSLVHYFEGRYDNVRVVATDLEDGFGNLYSLKTGLDAVKSDEFLVLMSDHIFEPEILRKLIREGGEKAFTLCLDQNPPWDRIEEGLKVVVRDDQVMEVGKNAPPYYGVDTGLFYCSSGSKRIIEETIRERGPEATVADALRRAIREREVGYVDVTGYTWADIDTPEDLVKARKALPYLLRKSLIKPGDGPVSRYLNRPLSTRLSVWMYLRGKIINPNIISVTSFLLCLIGVWMAVIGHLVLSGIMVQGASILDGVDGEIARLTGAKSRFGSVFDAFLDRYADLAVVGAAGYMLWPLSFSQMVLLIVAAANVFVSSYVSHISGWVERRDVELLRSWSPAGRDARLLVAAISIAAGIPWVLILYLVSVPLAFSIGVVALAATELPRVKYKILDRPPMPQVKVKPHRIRVPSKIEKNLGTFLSSTIKLAIVILILKSTEGLISGLDPFEIGGIKLYPTSVAGFLELVAVVYFGYRILMSLKFFVDLMSGWLVRRIGVVTRVAVKRSLVDMLYLAFIAFLMWVTPPKLYIIPKIGVVAARVTQLGLLATFMLILYDLAKLFYRSFKGVYDRMIARAAEKLRQVFEERHILKVEERHG